jgi:hypothetical protein
MLWSFGSTCRNTELEGGTTGEREVGGKSRRAADIPCKLRVSAPDLSRRGTAPLRRYRTHAI